MKKFTFWSFTTGEMFNVFEEDTMEAINIAHELFGPELDILSVVDADESEMEEM